MGGERVGGDEGWAEEDIVVVGVGRATGTNIYPPEAGDDGKTPI